MWLWGDRLFLIHVSNFHDFKTKYLSIILNLIKFFCTANNEDFSG